MTDLAILVPSRGRPASVARLLEACARTCRTGYVLHLGFDDDDPTRLPGGPHVSVQPRMGLVAWTNHLASLYANRPPAYFASLGDDMVPLTDGWDEQLITAIEHTGGGYAYPDDRHRNDIPEAVIVSAPIVRALGWMALPSLDHFYCDDVWGALGRGAGCLTYCPQVIVEHRHPLSTGAPHDQTYADAAPSFETDRAAYRRWRLYQMHKDIATVRTCLNPP